MDKLDNLGRKLLLFDVYGALLTEKQQQAMELTYNEDLSLGEIAAMQGVSRQAVFDAIRRAEDLLESYDEKLGLVERNRAEQEVCSELAKAQTDGSWQQVQKAADRLRGLISR